jgi:hypothetical protein
MGDPPASGLGEGLTIPHRKKPGCYETLHSSSGGTDSLRWEDNIRMDLNAGRVWTGFVWLIIGANGELL